MSARIAARTISSSTPRGCAISAAPPTTGRGWSRPLDPADFLAKPFNPLSGWPIAQMQLDPYRSETDAILDIPSASEAPGPSLRAVRLGLPPLPVPLEPAHPLRREVPGRAHGLRADRLVLNANLVDLRLTRRSRRRLRGGLPLLRPGRSGLHRAGAGLLPLHRRHREPAPPAQLPQPEPGGHRQPARGRRPVLLRAPAFRGRRRALAAPGGRARVLRPDRELHLRARMPELRHAAGAELGRAGAARRAGAPAAGAGGVPDPLEGAGARALHTTRAWRAPEPRCRRARPGCCGSPPSRR